MARPLTHRLQEFAHRVFFPWIGGHFSQADFSPLPFAPYSVFCLQRKSAKRYCQVFLRILRGEGKETEEGKPFH
jgi:hypothetical protein